MTTTSRMPPTPQQPQPMHFAQPQQQQQPTTSAAGGAASGGSSFDRNSSLIGTKS
ncbi:hypothetical protein CpipJ_CPIJ015263 [Culex quinquefasciatus]|uniref:Uncharacterized protein n=1 Tax=Culex quinquefasciatus TaxID=7176 RepID=B0X7P9_CULQU|nr:hypothetical protein CpipJ_CPIJ015263 [Culex quinquefasciatus]|eukprot:XP_001865671.1 hypothetical protein CpipJ_CPIJ015263 [Culex quinquefasciatus]